MNERHRVDDDLVRAFRPRAARVVSLGLAVLAVCGTGVLLVSLPSFAPAATSADAVGFALLGLVLAWFCWREASVVAVPDATGLRVRNLMLSRRVAWAEIVSVRFGAGRPWVQLDLADGSTLAVMGIQRADGAHAEAEARRLATIVVVRSRTDGAD